MGGGVFLWVKGVFFLKLPLVFHTEFNVRYCFVWRIIVSSVMVNVLTLIEEAHRSGQIKDYVTSKFFF